MARKQKLEQLHQAFLERRSALRQALAGDDSLLRQISQRSGGDEADFALECASIEVDSQLVEVVSRELANVENALSQIQNGKYGKCETCGCNIPAERLSVMPYATSCITCQRAAEQGGSRNGNSSDWSRILEPQPDDLRITDLDVNVS